MTNRRSLLLGLGALLGAPAIVKASSLMPVKADRWFPDKWVPEGWIVPTGQTLWRRDYPELFAAIGTNYGAGDGATTFQLPMWGPAPHTEGIRQAVPLLATGDRAMGKIDDIGAGANFVPAGSLMWMLGGVIA
jgi:hypothetical protein